MVCVRDPCHFLLTIAIGCSVSHYNEILKFLTSICICWLPVWWNLHRTTSVCYWSVHPWNAEFCLCIHSVLMQCFLIYKLHSITILLLLWFLNTDKTKLIIFTRSRNSGNSVPVIYRNSYIIERIAEIIYYLPIWTDVKILCDKTGILYKLNMSSSAL